MKRRQKRYTEESQLIAEIDKAKEKAKQCLEQAIACDLAVEECHRVVTSLEQVVRTTKKKSEIDDLVTRISAQQHVAKLKKDEAVRLSKRRNTLEQVTLPKLKDALAAFRTALLSYTDDPGVVLK